MKGKIFNYRPMFLAFISFLLGILILHYAYSSLYIALFIFLLISGLIIYYSIKHKTVRYFLICIIMAVVGALGFWLQIRPYSNLKDYSHESIVEGEVIDIESGYYSKLTLNNAKINGEKIDGKIYISYEGTTPLTTELVGSLVSMNSSYLVKETVKIGDESRYYYVYSNIKYFAKTYEINSVKEIENPKNWTKNKVRNILHRGFNNENAEFIFSAIFGDKTFLTDSVYDDYKLSGIVHVLAVSGLHVGIVVAIISFILKLLHCNKYARLIISICLLSLYSYLCSWSAPVIRASIMAVVLMISSLTYRQYDGLSALSFAGILVLIVGPVALFSASFLMSFVAVFGIFMFYPIFNKLFAKIKLNNTLKETFSMSLAVNISLIPIMTYFFNEVNFTGIISNIFILPLFSIIFSITFVLSFVSIGLPFLSSLLYLVNPFINVMNFIAGYFASFAYIKSPLKFTFLTSFIFLIALFFVSKFSVLKPKWKLLNASTILTILLAFMLIDRYVYMIL